MKTEIRPATFVVPPARQGTAHKAPSNKLDLGDIEKFFRDNFDSILKDGPGALVDLLSPIMGNLDLFGLIKDLPWDQVRSVLSVVDPPEIQDATGDKFVSQTQDLRDTLTSIRSLQAQLQQLPANDPRRPALEQQLQTANQHLSSTYGYSADNAPKPGSVWIDPHLMNDVPGGKVSASQFPIQPAVTTPPSPDDLLFANGKTFSLMGRDGQPVVLHNAAEYHALIAKNRAALGLPADGTPKGVQLDLQGGGGRGKRYTPALNEMYKAGVVPTSVAGTSVGSIAACLIAAGADPKTIMDFPNDPRLKNWLDFDPSLNHGALCDGQVAYDTLDQKLREITGIKDRPVTFADLKMPCQICAAVMSDSAGGDLSTPKSRAFIFSQETTPNTPVALAVRASMAIPGAWNPVQMIDPTTGRRVDLIDGGAVDGLPMDYSHNNLPKVGFALVSQDQGAPAGENVAPVKPLPSGSLDSTHLLWNIAYGVELVDNSAAEAADFQKRMHPRDGSFMLSLPDFNIDHPDQADDTFGLSWDPKIDPAMDQQSASLTRDFLRNVIGKLDDPKASYTNTTDVLPKALRFDVPVTVGGVHYTAHYTGGDTVHYVDGNGDSQDVQIGKDVIDAMYLDGKAFGQNDFAAQLALALQKDQDS